MTAGPAESVPLAWIHEIGSTQAELVGRASAGAGEQALATTSQTGGRGRRGREWSCPAGSGLAMSVLLRPPRPDGWTWLPLVSGIAVVEALGELDAPGLSLKWPNDVLCPRGKLAGLIAERVEGSASGCPPAFVLGVGLNLRPEGLPPGSASLAELGVGRSPAQVAHAVLGSLRRWVGTWATDSSAVRSAYEQRCATLGHEVRVMLPGGDDIAGRAVALDEDGRLVVSTPTGSVALAAGDVVHLRPR